jgi:hypothetical protein
VHSYFINNTHTCALIHGVNKYNDLCFFSVVSESNSNIFKPEVTESCVKQNHFVRQPLSVLHYTHTHTRAHTHTHTHINTHTACHVEKKCENGQLSSWNLWIFCVMVKIVYMSILYVPIFQENLLPPSSWKPHLTSLSMTALNCEETLVPIYRFTWCHVPENWNLYHYCCVNLKTFILEVRLSPAW